MPSFCIRRTVLFLGVFIFLLPLAKIAEPCLPSDPDSYAVLLSTPEGAILSVKAKVKAPGSEALGAGELRAHLRYRLQPPAESKKFLFAVSRPVAVEGLGTGEPIPLEFDFSESAIPAGASHLTLKILYQEDADAVPILVSEYRTKNLRRETSEILVPTLPPLQGSVSIWGPVIFVRETGKPKTEQAVIPIADATGPFILRLINGGTDGKHRVSSASIRLNGREVFKPCELNQRIRELNRQVMLIPGENFLEVKLRSAPESQVTLELFRLEKSGCSAFDVHTFVRKRGKPVVEEVAFELSPEFGGPYTLNLFNGDPDGSHRVDSAVIKLNGQQVFSPYNFNEQVGILSQIVSLQEKNILSVELRGAPGDFLSLGITGYDHTPPRVEITSPADGAVFAAGPITVTGLVYDLSASVKVNEVAVPVAKDGSFVLEGVALQQGENIIRVVAVDPCGNEGEDQILVHVRNLVEGPPLRFCTRFSMPTLLMTLESEEEECRTQAYTRGIGRVSGTTDQSAVSVTINGIVLPNEVEIVDQGDIAYAYRDGTTFSASLKIPQEDGVYPFTAVATNSAGGRTEATVAFVRDTIAPNVVITSPPDGWVTNTPSVTVTGTVDDPQASVWWFYDAPPIPVNNGIFTVEIPLYLEGENGIGISAYDPIWNFGYASILVFLDMTPPQIEITSPAEGVAVKNTVLNFTGTILDENPSAVTITINGGVPQPVDLSDSSFRGAVALTPGPNTLGFTATDRAGNTSHLSRTVFLDTEPPLVTIVSPAAGTNISGMISVSVNAEDGMTGIATVTLLVDNRLQATLTQPPFMFSLDTAMLAMGSHTITAVGTDQAGNQVETSISVSISRFMVEIISPANGETINKSRAIVQGKIHNQTGEIGVVVNGVLAEVQGDDFAVVVPLRLGQNMVTATATTAGGLQAQSSVIINTETQQEFVRLSHYPTSGILKMPGNNLEVTFEVEAYLENPIVSYSWDFDGDGVGEIAGNETRITNSFYAPGFYYPKVTATDTQGLRYEETTLLQVVAREDLEPILRSKWEGMRNALVNGDIEGALEYFVAAGRDSYRKNFTEIGQERIQYLFSNVVDFKIFTLYGRVAGCGAIRMESGKRYAYPVNFVKDENGIWRIRGL